MTVDILGNLDCEIRWRGAAGVPEPVARRIAALATTLRGLVEADHVTVWTGAAVDPARIRAVPGLPAVTVAIGAPPAGGAIIAWGASEMIAGSAGVPLAAITTALDPALRAAIAAPPPTVAIARAVNDRRFALALASRVDAALAGTRTIASVPELEHHLAGGATASPTESWVVKAPLCAAGRDRVRGTGRALDPATARAVERLVVAHGELVFEPWLDRMLDLGVTGAIDASGAVVVLPPHQLHSDRGGGFRGITVSPPPLEAGERDRLDRVSHAVGAALAAKGHRGPFTVDAIVHRDLGGERRLHPLVEINARLSFGVVARALCGRLGRTRFVVGVDPPADALVLVAPGAEDRSAAWLE